MSYNYKTERPYIFTEEGQRMFLDIRDKSQQLIRDAGAFRMQEVMLGLSGSTWAMLACIDRLIELKEIREVTSYDVADQHRIFTEP